MFQKKNEISQFAKKVSQQHVGMYPEWNEKNKAESINNFWFRSVLWNRSRIRMRIRIGSGFHEVPGSAGSGLRIRIRTQEGKALDPDSLEMPDPDPQLWFKLVP